MNITTTMAMVTITAMYLFTVSVKSQDDYLFLQDVGGCDLGKLFFWGVMPFHTLEPAELQKSFTLTRLWENQKSLYSLQYPRKEAKQ
jgi:hypothetical protein